MAIRVELGQDLSFGTMSAEVMVTHGRFQKAGAVPVVKQLAAVVTVPAGRRAQVPDNMLDVVYPAGELTNAHVRAVVELYWSTETFQIDLMTDADTVVNDSGYSQQTNDDWDISEEAD